MRPVVLIVLDGWGLSPQKQGNAIAAAETPTMDYFMEHFPYFVLDASSESVGLTFGKLGNSEVGHMTLGTGQIVYQYLARITAAVRDGSFFSSPALLEACLHAKKHKSRLHLIGLYSPGGIHSYLEHCHALLKLARDKGVQDVFLHLFTDGRDSPPYSAIDFLPLLEKTMEKCGVGRIASLMGRFYAMDRNKNWERTQRAYNALTRGSEIHGLSPKEALDNYYHQGVSDEFLEPVTLVDEQGAPLALIKDNDAVICFNFREDRMRQLASAFVSEPFEGFARSRLQNVFFVSFTNYGNNIPVSAVAFPPKLIKETLGCLIASAGMKQMRLAESEKAAHVTYFFNGGSDVVYPGETRNIVPSPIMKDFENIPEMSAAQVAEETVKAIRSRKYDFILVNFANPDMVGHTGNFLATVRAVSCVDKQLKIIWDTARRVDAAILVVGDHGNAEEKISPITGVISKEHTINPVPFLIAHSSLLKEKNPAEVLALKAQFQPSGVLPDVTATILKLLQLKKPASFIGQSLI